MQVNKFLVHEDEERRVALRAETKRDIASLSIKRERLKELQSLVAKLDRDSDDAADVHAAATGELQAELDALDAEHVQAIVDGKQSSAKSLQRRSAILAQLATLNGELESRCEANKRAKQPFERQIAELRKEIVAGVTLEANLTRLCSAQARTRISIAEFDVRIAEMGLSEAQRRHGIHTLNYDNAKDWDDSQYKGRESSESAILRAKLEESNALLADRKQRLDAAMEASRNAHAAAMSE